MRTECLFESPVEVVDSAGGQTVTWGSPSFQCFAAVETGKALKKLFNSKQTMVRWAKLTLWYNPALVETMRVSFNGRSCRILSIENWKELEQYHIVVVQDGEGT